MPGFDSLTMSNEFDILLLSPEKALYNQFTTFVENSNAECTVKYSGDLSDFQSLESNLQKCGVVLCDIRSGYSFLEAGARALECAPNHAFTLALKNGTRLPHEALELPSSLRLSGIINIKEGWESNWENITKIRTSLYRPLMASRIEDVPVSDVLQMIAIGGWSAVVRIDGCIVEKDVDDTNCLERIRGGISFQSGVPTTAWSSHHIGIEAIYELLSLNHGILRVIKHAWIPDVRNLHWPMEQILLSYAFSIDQSQTKSWSTTINLDKLNCIEEHVGAERTEPVSSSAENKKSHSAAQSKIVSGRKGHSARNPLESMVASIEPGTLPLRWMSNADIADLKMLSARNMILTVRAEDSLLSSFFGVLSKKFSPDKLSGNSFPVIRLGRTGGVCYYLAGIGMQKECEILNGSPTVLYTETKNASSFVQDLDKKKVPVAVLLCEKPDAVEEAVRKNSGNVNVRYKCLSCRVDSIDDIAPVLKNITALTSDFPGKGAE
ncbi:MAG: hypothetical protein GF401_06615 [Chitinivibrionales bacterium]|nr:hypothetical protein [Chitinivibrionales bacterium]